MLHLKKSTFNVYFICCVSITKITSLEQLSSGYEGLLLYIISSSCPFFNVDSGGNSFRNCFGVGRLHLLATVILCTFHARITTLVAYSQMVQFGNHTVLVFGHHKSATRLKLVEL